MTKPEAIAAVDAIARDIASLSGPLMSWRHSPDALDRLAISALRDRVQSLAESMAGAPVEDEAAIPVRADASAQGGPVDPSVEADEAAGACEFDGRLSLACLNGRYLIYARANVADRNARFVQVWGCLGRH